MLLAIAILVPACLAEALLLFHTQSLRPGLVRLLAWSPCVAFNLAAPLSLLSGRDGPALLLALFLTANLSWWTTAKVLAAALGRTASPSPCFARFACELLLPITLADGDPGPGGQPPSRLLASAAVKAALLWLLCGITDSSPGNHGLASWGLAADAARGLGLFLLLSIPMDLAGACACLGLNSGSRVHVVPAFRAPYAAASAADFWRRWNVTAARGLRSVVYCPAAEGRWVASDSRPRVTDSSFRRLAASAATFAASGLIHEALLRALCGRGLESVDHGLGDSGIHGRGRTYGGGGLAFFLGCWALAVGEGAVGSLLRRWGCRLPSLPRPVAAFGVCVVHAAWAGRTLFADARAAGLEQRLLEAIAGR